MMTTDEWVTAALADDAMVVELLFRLNQSSDFFASQQPKSPPPLQLVLPFGWGHRQPRSKPAAAATTRKERDSMRGSPTTPLSWSCGGSADASPSDGCDESSRPSDRSSGGRSKGTFTNDTIAATTTTNKRSRRKKTFAELKEEESLLLKERTSLKKALASLHLTFKEQKARSENLKRLKLDRQLPSPNKTRPVSDDDPNAVNSGQFNSGEASAPADQIPVSPTSTTHDNCPAPDSYNVEKEVETTERCFILPDLNETPSEEDSNCEALHGLSR